ncbi:hypothetical protein ACJX0J_010363, partial [Zea mays]
ADQFIKNYKVKNIVVYINMHILICGTGMVTICSPRGIKWGKNHPHRVWRGRVWYPIP